MTERDLYDAALIETNKLEAPSMLLEDYIYFINKAIQQYINKVYNRYEINQQATDDLRALRVNTTLNVLSNNDPVFPGERKEYYCELPKDYWHILSCIVTFSKNNTSLCNDGGSTLTNSAKKMTSDVAPSIINNAYFKPSYKNPYYTIIGSSFESPLASITDSSNLDEDHGYKINIFCGDDTKCVPTFIHINYLKTPQRICITEDDLDGPDNTRTLEFPEYVCYEIVNEFVKLLLENTADPRLSTNVPINQTVIPPVTE